MLLPDLTTRFIVRPGVHRVGALGRGRDLRFLVGAEVAVGLVPDHAVVADDAAAGAAERARRRARAGAEVRAADVERGRIEAGNERDQAGQAAAVRQVVELLLIPVDGDLRRLEVDGRRLAGDGHGFLSDATVELAVDRHRRAGAEVHAFDVQRGEAGELELHGVGAAREQREAIHALSRR